MGATAAAVGEWLSGSAATAGAAETAGVMGATAASGAGAGFATEAAVGSGLAAQAATAGATALGTGVVTGLLAPKPPKAPGVLPMPDPLAQEQARQKSFIDQMARRGRAATILTDTSATGDKLGG